MARTHLLSRRRFLRSTLGVGSAAMLTPQIVRAQTLGRAGTTAANSRVGMGFIGLGLISRGHLRTFAGMKEVQPLAVCDVRASQIRGAVADLEKRGHRGLLATADFEEVLAHPDIDAVCVLTPDHWHAAIAIAAMKAGKDVYVEKPMTLTIEEGKRMVEAEAKYGRIVQVGTQQRSSVHFRMAADLIRQGRIGEVKEIYAQLGQFPQPPAQPELKPVPDGFDYDKWLGPAPWHEYSEHRVKGDYNGGWRCYWDYGSRKFGDWGAHHFDIIQWALGRDETGPVEFIPRGYEGAAWHHFRYADGITVWRDRQPAEGMIRFIGSEGEVQVSRGRIQTRPRELVRTDFADDAALVYRSENHRQNFIDGVLTRRPTICPATVGHRSATICQLAGIAERTGERVTWDPRHERITSAGQAAGMQDRPRREGYALPTIS